VNKLINKVKEKISNGEKVLGVFLGIYSPSLIEMIGYSGYDFVVIDDEHGAFSHSEIENMVRAAELVGLVPIIRVSYDPSSIQKALDRGAKGIQVPMVNTKEDAERVVKRAKFPPHGQRGAAFAIRAARFGRDGGESYFMEADENLLISVHIETPEAVNNFKEIMSVPGIDMAFIGSTDLSVNMGFKAELANHPEVKQSIHELFRIANENGFKVGTVAANSAGAANSFKMGACYVGITGHSVIINAFDQVVNETKNNR
jgi:4-hydroxy-2-oxoheptanedioate aldolase